MFLTRDRLDSSKPGSAESPDVWRTETCRFAAVAFATSSQKFELRTFLLGAETDESTGQKVRK